MELHRVDLNLLVAFDAMLSHRSVTRAAESVGLSQPAMSSALARLRVLMGDPLFVKAVNAMQPTPRALAMAEPIRRVLSTVRSEILHSEAFTPAGTSRTFRLIMPDIAEAQFLPPMLERMNAEAPSARLRTLAMPPHAAGEALEQGSADLAVGYLPDLSKGSFLQQRLFRDGCMCIVREGHPIEGADMTLAQYLAASHVAVIPHGREHIFERMLKTRLAHRRVVLELTHFMSLLPIVAQSDLIATVPAALAKVCAAHAGIRMIAPPFKSPTVEIFQYWHRRMHKDAGSIWLRGIIREIFQERSASRA